MMRRPAAPWGWFAAWFATGTALVLGILGAFTIGIFILPVAAAATIYLATRRGATVGIAGLISGLGVPLLLVAAFNRSGPGDICTSNATSSSCVEESSPWPWLAIAVVLIALGVAVFVVSARRRANVASDPASSH
jgi:hypothetical protein